MSEVVDRQALRDPVLYVGRPWAESIIYELHVGAFSPEGTYAGVEKKLPYLSDLGITAIELMPLNDVPGQRTWGYDGVLLKAPNAAYGRPEDLKSLLHAAYKLDMMVYLDVVYNHFGAHLNYLHAYAKPFFSDHHATGWGPAVNLEGPDGEVVRDFLVENAVMWIRDYGFDGLRLDAVHGLKDDSEKHFLTELAEKVRAQLIGRHVHLRRRRSAPSRPGGGARQPKPCASTVRLWAACPCAWRRAREKNVPGIGIGRDGCRTPMQWDSTKSAGFSGADAWLPVADNYRVENVDSFRKDKGSLYWLYRRLINCRRTYLALAEGTYRPLTADGDLLLFCRELRDERVMVALNMGPEPIAVSFPHELSGRVLLASFADREGEEVRASIELRGNEGVLVKVAGEDR